MSSDQRIRKRGRPVGSGLDDRAALEAIAQVIAVNPNAKPTRVFRNQQPDANEATVRRIQAKWRVQKDRLLATAQAKLDAPVADRPVGRHWGSVGPASSLLGEQIEALASRIYEEQNLSSAIRAAREMAENSSVRAMRDMLESATMRAAREFYDSPTMRAMRELQDSPTLRGMRAYQENSAAQHARDMVQRHSEQVDRIRRAAGLY